MAEARDTQSEAAQTLQAGNTAGLATLVEHALVGLIVPVIDFLADYLGLGGIPDAIRDLILGLQQRIEEILIASSGLLGATRTAGGPRSCTEPITKVGMDALRTAAEGCAIRIVFDDEL